MLQTMLEMTRSQGAITEAIKSLQITVERLLVKMDKVDDLRVAVGKLETSVTAFATEMDSTKTKLDAVRKWVIGAAAVIMVAGALIPLVIRFWPSATSSAPIAAAAPSGSKSTGR